MTISPLPTNPDDHGEVKDKVNELVDDANTKDMGGRYSIKPVPDGVGSNPEALGLYETVSGVESFIGAIGDTFSSQLVFTTPLGGVRFFNESDSFEYFISRRDVSGDALGATFGNPDGANYFSTRQDGGLTVYHVTATDIDQQLGNASSTNYIEADTFTFQVTSDQVRPYGNLVLSFLGETDVDFAGVPFDTRIFDSTGTQVYSKIQNSEVWDVEPQPVGDPRFTISSAGGVFEFLAPQPFPMDSATTYTVEQRLKQSIRVKGDGLQPAYLMKGKQIEYYPINYTATIGQSTVDFNVISGGEYKIDTSGGPIVATVHPTVKSAWFGDYASTWSNTNSLTLSTDLGDIVFGNPENGKRFQVVRNGVGWRIYNADGSLHATAP